MHDITVIVPSLGTRNELTARTLRSIAGQDLSAAIILVDASGEDKVPDVWPSVEAGLVRVERADRLLSAGEARQLGSDRATTRWIAYCDDDDLWAPSKLRRQMAALSASGLRWSTTNAVRFAPGPRLLDLEQLPEPWTMANLRQRNCIPGGGSGVVVEASAIWEVGGWSTDLTNAEDWDMWLRLATLGPPSHVAEPLVAYRVHPGNKSGMTPKLLASIQTISRRHGLHQQDQTVERWMVDRCLDVGDAGGASDLASLLDVPRGDVRARLSRFIIRVAPRIAVRRRRRRQSRHVREALGDTPAWMRAEEAGSIEL